MKLIPPAITDGEWEVSSGERIRSKSQDYPYIADCLLRPGAQNLHLEALANARFLANSKRLAEVAAAVMQLYLDESWPAENDIGAFMDLRDALLASGYTEESKP